MHEIGEMCCRMLSKVAKHNLDHFGGDHEQLPDLALTFPSDPSCRHS